MPQTKPTHEFKGFDDDIEVFRAGTHTDSKGREKTFTESDLDQMVVNAQTAPVPAVVGHPDSTAPAYGWGNLKRVGSQLYAKFSDVHPAFEAAVKAKSYPNRSVSVAHEKAKGWVMQHVGWLGGVAPAIEGLKPVSFSSSAETLEFSSTTAHQGTKPMTTLTQADIDKAVATARQEEQKKAAEDKVAADKLMKDNEAKFSAQGKEIAELRAERVKEKVSTTVNKLKAEGKLLPAHEAGMAEFMTSLESLPEKFEFSKGEGKVTKSPSEFFSEFMAAMPELVKLNKKSDGNGKADADVDAEDPQALANAALAYMNEQASKGVTIHLPAAIAHVSKQAASA